MDIKAKIEEVVNKVKNDEALRKQFQKEPVKAVEKVLGVDLPDDVIEKIAEGVKAKISVDKLSGVVDSFKKLF